MHMAHVYWIQTASKPQRESAAPVGARERLPECSGLPGCGEGHRLQSEKCLP